MVVAPRLKLDGLPQEEKRNGEVANSALLEMGMQVQHFAHAVMLFEHVQKWSGKVDFISNDGAMLHDWRFIACREAAMCVYHFGEAMKAAKANLRKCPTLWPQVSPDGLRAATKHFEADFPGGGEGMRQTVAHWAEVGSTLKEISENVAKATFDDGMHAGEAGSWPKSGLDGRRYVTMHRGVSYSLEVSLETADKLKTILDSISRAIAAVAYTDP